MTNFLNYVDSVRDYQNMDVASIECLINDCAHVAAMESNLTFPVFVHAFFPFLLEIFTLSYSE